MKKQTNTNYKRILFIAIALIGSFFLIGKNKQLVAQHVQLDSLKTLLRKAQSDTTKVNHLNKTSSLYLQIRLYDSALYYCTSALHLAEQLNFKKGIAHAYDKVGRIYSLQNNTAEAIKNYLIAKKIFEEIDDKKGLADTYFSLGIVYSDMNNWPEALQNQFKALKIANDIKDQASAASISNRIAAVYQEQDNYPEALKFLFISLQLKEDIGDKKGMASTYNNIGAIYYNQNNYKEALKNYTLSLKTRKEINDIKGVAICYNNIGLVYQDMNNNYEALINFQNSLKIANEVNYKLLVADASQNIGGIYIKQKNYPEALKSISYSLKVNEELDNRYGIAISLIHLGEIQIGQNEIKLAQKNLNKAIAIGKEIESLHCQELGYEGLTRTDSIQGNWKEAYKHHKLSIVYRDSINNEESNKKITEITLTNRFEKQQEKTKAENEKQRAIEEERTRRQTLISWSIGGGLFLVLIFAGFILRSLRITNKQKNLIEQQKNEVSKQKDIADSQRILAEELRHIAEKQKHLVEEKQKEIVDSITYAKRIQTALLTSDNYIQTNFEAEHFILFKPKDIVSGDFYWALSHAYVPGWDLGISKVKLQPEEKRKNLFYLATADCTGHGVPGAFMSMLNISYLNENIIERGILLPHEVLNSQRNEIIKALNPAGSKIESKDGMDCVLCVYDFNKMLLHFAAANNPLWLVRNNELTEYKADKMPVGKYGETNNSFTLQTIELQKGDTIYTSTDGYADQFGMNDKKLMKKRFKEELLKIHQLPMLAQKQHLDLFFENWKGSTDQVDDVCVIGVRI